MLHLFVEIKTFLGGSVQAHVHSEVATPLLFTATQCRRAPVSFDTDSSRRSLVNVCVGGRQAGS